MKRDLFANYYYLPVWNCVLSRQTQAQSVTTARVCVCMYSTLARPRQTIYAPLFVIRSVNTQNTTQHVHFRRNQICHHMLSAHTHATTPFFVSFFGAFIESHISQRQQQ